MAEWPTSLPPLGQIGAKIADDDAVVRSNMDAGPPSRRNRYTAITKSLSYTMTLDGGQVATLKTFYRDTLRNGALTFDWVDPVDDSAASIAFKQPPEYTARVGAPNPVNRVWVVQLSLEIQP